MRLLVPTSPWASVAPFPQADYPRALCVLRLINQYAIPSSIIELGLLVARSSRAHLFHPHFHLLKRLFDGLSANGLVAEAPPAGATAIASIRLAMAIGTGRIVQIAKIVGIVPIFQIATGVGTVLTARTASTVAIVQTGMDREMQETRPREGRRRYPSRAFALDFESHRQQVEDINRCT